MSGLKLPIDRSHFQAELIQALHLHLRDRPITLSTTEAEDELFSAAFGGSVTQMDDLLSKPSLLDTAFERKLRLYALSQVEFSNLYLMVLMAFKAGQASMTKYLLGIAKTHNVPYETIIRKNTIMATVKHNNIGVCRELVQVMPECVNLDLEYCGRPLSRVIGQSHKQEATISEQTETEYVKLFLENGANPTVRTGRRKSNGVGLTAAAAHAPLEVVKLLIQYGAIAPQSGALQVAVGANRIEVLDVLLEHGVDVNERLQEPLDHSTESEAKREEGI